jgi:hypothetical protein
MTPVSYATTSRLCNTEELIFIDLPWVSSLGKVNPSDGDWYSEPEHIQEIESLALCLLYIQTFQESSGGIPPRIHTLAIALSLHVLRSSTKSHNVGTSASDVNLAVLGTNLKRYRALARTSSASAATLPSQPA